MSSILITGSTDGIGLEVAKDLAAKGHSIIVHGRSQSKIDAVAADINPAGYIKADLSNVEDIKHLAEQTLDIFPKIDVLINNAGVLKTAEETTPNGTDMWFMVNTIAPFLLKCNN